MASTGASSISDLRERERGRKKGRVHLAESVHGVQLGRSKDHLAFSGIFLDLIRELELGFQRAKQPVSCQRGREGWGREGRHQAFRAGTYLIQEPENPLRT